MEVNNQIPVLTQNNWNTWKHDMQVILIHYGCWQFIIQTKLEEFDEGATYKENNFLSKKLSKVPRNVNTVPGGTTATPADPSVKTEYQKKDGKVFNSKTTKHLKWSSKMIGPYYLCNKYGHLKEKNSREKPPSTANETYNTEFNINLRFCEAECVVL
ncbi:hypothetical protein TNCT_106641 [Trichonephila clavata]|uniref:DUF4219 domain-containing protein n=1 Tax=Trichonephila clavata TaxID=2740835 RepID=A0A8X6G7X1_TRICU|nr:hypothetical protein TNCT_106641 [Trichonephila clavata]